MKGRGKRGARLVGVADGVRHAGVGHAGHCSRPGQRPGGALVARHDGAVAIAHDLDVFALVIRIGIPVVHPEERADLHLVAGGRHGLKALGRDAHDLAGPELVGVLVPELVVDEALKGDAVPLARLIAADKDGEASHPVAGGEDDAVLGHDEQGERALDRLLGKLDALDQIVLLVDEGRHELGAVDRTRAHRHKLRAALLEIRLDQLVGVIDDADRGDGERPVLAAHQKRLRIGVADAPDTARAVKALEVLVEARAERRVLDGVNFFLKPARPLAEHHARSTRAQMRMVVDAKKHIEYHVAARSRPKETAHRDLSRTKYPTRSL